MQSQEWSQLLLCSCQPRAVLSFIPESARESTDQKYHSSLEETRLLVEPTWVKPMCLKPDSFCSCSHSLPRMGLLGALRSCQGRIESYHAGKMENIAFAGKLSGHTGNI